MICNEKERQKLYDEVWAEPMTVVAKRYTLSDTGLRKRCRSWGIPLPPFGYWAKKNSNKPIAERPPLPPLIQVIHELASDDKISFSFDDSDKELFDEWCSLLEVPAQIRSFDPLIENHIAEMATREKKVKYAFVNELPITEQWQYDRDYSRPNPVVAITVSKTNKKRAYCFMHYFFQCIRQIHGVVSVQWGEEDNTTIRIGYLQFSCSISEMTIKRRDLNMTKTSMQPAYEEIYNGLLRLTIKEIGNYYSIKPQPLLLSYCDQEGNPLEAQVNRIFGDIYRHISSIKKAENEKMAEEEKHRAETLRLERKKQDAINLQREREERERKQRDLLAFANQHMARWRQIVCLEEYLIEMREYAETMMPEAKQKVLDYCNAIEACINNKDVLIEEVLQRTYHT